MLETIEKSRNLDEELTQLLIEEGAYTAPLVLAGDRRDEDQAEWAIAGVVIAAVSLATGVSLGVVAYICSVCQARSFDACVRAVQNYFGAGC